jgi:hypothetical protein
MHDGEGFFLMGSIISFMRVHLVGGECDRLRSLALILHEDSSYCKVRSISGYCEGQVRMQRTGALIIHFLRSLKASIACEVQVKGTSLCVRSVMGAAILE